MADIVSFFRGKRGNMIYYKCERKRRREEARASPKGTHRESYHYEEGREKLPYECPEKGERK